MDVIAEAPKPIVPIDPRTKLCLVFTVAVFVFTNLSPVIELGIWMILSLMLLSYRIRRFTLFSGIVFFGMLIIDVFVAPHLTGWLGPLVLAIVRIPRYILLILMGGNLLIKTTTVSEFTSAFTKMHLPETIVIPFSVMFRFVPTIQEEWHSILNAMKLRGIASSPIAVIKAPMQTMEYALVPLLMSTSTISGELAAASLSRGLEIGNKRTCLKEIRFTWADYLLFALCISLAAYQIGLSL